MGRGADLRKELFCLIRENSRSSLSEFSREKGLSVKKVHYEYNKIKNLGFEKFSPLINFESLGFFRLIVVFNDSVEGLVFSSKYCSYFINNSLRLDKGLLVEYIFYTVEEKRELMDELKSSKLDFDFFCVDTVLKQEGFLIN